jgi:Uma2 family endonuclease
MGYYEARIAAALIYFLESFAWPDRGIVTGADGAVRLMPKLVRVPDVAFVSWDQFPNRVIPRKPLPNLAPDLAVEVLSESNTAKEMKRKISEYFNAGAKLVWIIDPEARTVHVYTAPDRFTVLTEEQILDGGVVLPGFSLPLQQLFARLGPGPTEDKPAKPNKPTTPRRPKRKK